MTDVSVLFLIQNFEVKGFEDCAAYREIVKPMLASGLVSDHRIQFFEQSHEMIEPALGKRLSDYQREFGDRKLVVYGAGLHTQALMPKLRQFNIVAFADRDERLWGSMLESLPVIDPKRVPEFSDLVLVSSRAFEGAIVDDLAALHDDMLSILPMYQGLVDKEQWHDEIASSVNSELAEFDADILFFAPTHPGDNLSPKYFERLKLANPKLKVVTLWWDYDEQEQSQLYLQFERDSLLYSDLVIENTNATRLEKMKRREGLYIDHVGAEKVIFHPTSPDPELFFPRALEKKYDVAIFGSSAGERKGWIEFLQSELGDRFHHIGGISHDDQTLPIEDYAIAMSQAAIVINTQTYPFRKQCKGKVREALASKVLLLEEWNAETEVFVGENNLDWFRSRTELLEKIEFYLRHSSERESLAAQGYHWFSNNRSAKAWTRLLLTKIGLSEEGFEDHAL